MIYFLYDYIYTGLTSITAMLCYCGYTGTEKISPAMYAVSLLPSVFLTLLTHLKLKGRLMLLGITAAGSAGTLLVYWRAFGHLSTEEHPWIFPLFLISLTSYAAGILMARTSAARMLFSAAALLLLISALKPFIRLPAGAVFPAMGLIIVSVANEVQIRWRKEGFTDEKKHVVYTMPFIALIVVTASLIHYPDKPYDWHEFMLIRDGILSAIDRLEYSFGPVSDNITGFSGDGRLLTGLTPSDTKVLSVTAYQDTGSPIYFTGMISDTFDGHEWRSTDTSDISERLFDVLESISSARSYSDELRDYYRDTGLSVEYLDTKSKYLFAPSKLTAKDELSGRSSAEEKGGNIRFKRYSPYHLSLNERYLRSNSDNPGFYAYMESDIRPGEKQWKEALATVKMKDPDGLYSYERYAEYKKHIKDTYTEEITLSDELAEKINKLYEGTDSEYERLKRLEASFQKMKYTLDPPAIPDTVESPSAFLDYFLSGGGGGYCSYYATAFVLLARAEGLPARYIQGYRIPAEKKGTYTVTSAMAHAWPEIYFEGKGWIAFEPTPGFYSESAWTMSSDDRASFHIPRSSSLTPPKASQVSGNEAVTEHEPNRAGVYFIIVPISLILVFFLIFFLINRTLQIRRLSRMGEREKLVFLAKDSLSILRLLGAGILEGETLSEYRARIKSSVKSGTLSFIPCYEAILYSDPENLIISPDSFRACHKKLMELLKEKSRFRYIIKLLL